MYHIKRFIASLKKTRKAPVHDWVLLDNELYDRAAYRWEEDEDEKE